ncbi:hypothetical protein VXJ36_20590 [Pseudomonas nitroreducens]|uniref:hypothetical protein n=1 Tax=Pseudomonas nitroreducens TaxID=46680 RepID=UPI002F355477
MDFQPGAGLEAFRLEVRDSPLARIGTDVKKQVGISFLSVRMKSPEVSVAKAPFRL